jgi:hypothetical protein
VIVKHFTTVLELELPSVMLSEVCEMPMGEGPLAFALLRTMSVTAIRTRNAAILFILTNGDERGKSQDPTYGRMVYMS